jgi:hypothetical protein
MISEESALVLATYVVDIKPVCPLGVKAVGHEDAIEPHLVGISGLAMPEASSGCTGMPV